MAQATPASSDANAIQQFLGLTPGQSLTGPARPVSAPSVSKATGKYLIGGGGSTADPAPMGHDSGKSGGNWFDDLLNTPIIKGIMNALGTGSYTVGNLMKGSADREQTVQNLKAHNAPQGQIDAAQADAYNPLNLIGDIISAPVKGIMGGIGQNPDFQVTPSKAIQEHREAEGMHDNLPLPIALGADILLDPLNMVNLGGPAAAVKGFVAGSRDARIANKIADAGGVAEKTNALDAGVQGAKDAMAARKAGILDQKSIRDTKQAQKASGIPAGMSDDTVQTVHMFPDNLQDGVVPTMADVKKAAKAEKTAKDVVDSAPTAESKLSAVQQVLGRPGDQQSAASIIGLADDSVLRDALKKPKYVPTPKTINESIMTEKAGKSFKPDSEITVKPEAIKSTLPPALKESDYSHFTPADRFVTGTEHLTTEVPKYPKTVQDKVTKYIQAVPDLAKMDPGALAKMGVQEGDFVSAMLGELGTLTKPSGNLKTIFNQMKTGEYLDPEGIQKFHDFMKNFSEDPSLDLPTAVDKALEFLGKNSEAVSKAEKSFAPTSIAGRLVGSKARSPQISVMKTLPTEIGQSFRKPLSVEESSAKLVEQGTRIDNIIAESPHAAEIQKLTDKLIPSAIDDLAIRSGKISADKSDRWFVTQSQVLSYNKAFDGATAALLRTAPKMKMGSPAWRAAHDEIVMTSLAKLDNTLKQAGIFPHLTSFMPKGGTPIRLSFYDILESMGSKLRQEFLYGAPQQIRRMSSGQLGDLAEVLMRSILAVGPDGSVAITKIRPEAIKILKGSFKSLDGVAREIEATLPHSEFNKSIIEANMKALQDMTVKNRDQAYVKLFNAFTKVGDNGASVVQNLSERLLENTQLHNTILTNKIIGISKETVDNLTKALDGAPSDFFNAVNGVKKITSDVEPEAATLATKVTGDDLGQFVTPLERMHADESRKVMAAGNQAEKNAANADIAERTMDIRINDPATVENGGLDSLWNVMTQDMASDLARRKYVGQRWFNHEFGMNSSTFNMLTAGSHYWNAAETAFHHVLNEFSKKFSTEQVNHAFANLRDGVNLGDPATVAIGKLMNHVFDVKTSNLFGRNGLGKDHLNAILRGNKSIPKDWRIVGDTPEEMAQSWKQWSNVQNPLKMIEATHRAMLKAMSDVSMAAKASVYVGLKSVPSGEVGRWFRIDANTIGRNRFASLLDPTRFYPREFLEQLPSINRLITESRVFKNKTVNDFFSEIFDPLVSAIKLTQTVMKPGHHIMSLESDMLRNAMLGVQSPTHYKVAWKIIRARQEAVKGFEGLDEYARVRSLGVGVKMTGEGAGQVFANIGRNGTKLSYDDLYKALEVRDVILPIHSTGIPEDLLTYDAMGNSVRPHGTTFKVASKAAHGLNDVVTKLTNNKVIKVNEFTAQRDNLMRLALADYYMKSRHFNNVNEAFDYASQMVRKAAPTAKDLAAAESKVARRIIFYYTWQRGIIPVVAEQALERPAVSVLPSKIMYDIALSNGLNPQSYGDPFPPDTIMPSYYKNLVLGPQWFDEKSGDYWGVNPASPLMDTLNTLGPGVSVGNLMTGQGEATIGKTLLGLTNPLIRGPVEITSGHNLATDAPVTDAGEYISDLFGPVRLGSQITGHTISPLDGGIPRRTEAKYRSGIGDAQAWQDNAIPLIMNYLTGAQIKDYTSEGASKNAQFEMKDKATQAKREAVRTQWWNR